MTLKPHTENDYPTGRKFMWKERDERKKKQKKTENC